MIEFTLIYPNKSYDEIYIIFTPHFKNSRNCDAHIWFYKSQRAIYVSCKCRTQFEFATANEKLLLVPLMLLIGCDKCVCELRSSLQLM